MLTGGIGASVNAAGWTGWAVSGMTSLTSKIYRGKGDPGTGPTGPGTGPGPTGPGQQQVAAPSPAAGAQKSPQGVPQ